MTISKLMDYPVCDLKKKTIDGKIITVRQEGKEVAMEEDQVMGVGQKEQELSDEVIAKVIALEGGFEGCLWPCIK